MQKNNDVPEDVVQKAIESVKDHPLHLEAKSKFYCVHDVYEKSKDFVDRAKLSDDERINIHKELVDVETLLIVSFFTSDTKPEPLSGFGKHYAFILHPLSYKVLLASVGTWRS
jgi:hypothetical protein